MPRLAAEHPFFFLDASPCFFQRRRSAAHVRLCVYPRRCRGLTEDVTARAVGQRLWSSGVPPARRQQGRAESRHTALRSAYRVMAECRRSATMSADVGGDGVTRPLARSGWRRCSGAGMASVEDEVRRADPLSVNFYLCTINRKLRETLRIVKKKDRDGELLC